VWDPNNARLTVEQKNMRSKYLNDMSIQLDDYYLIMEEPKNIEDQFDKIDFLFGTSGDSALFRYMKDNAGDFGSSHQKNTFGKFWSNNVSHKVIQLEDKLTCGNGIIFTDILYQIKINPNMYRIVNAFLSSNLPGFKSLIKKDELSGLVVHAPILSTIDNSQNRDLKNIGQSSQTPLSSSPSYSNENFDTPKQNYGSLIIKVSEESAVSTTEPVNIKTWLSGPLSSEEKSFIDPIVSAGAKAVSSCLNRLLSGISMLKKIEEIPEALSTIQQEEKNEESISGKEDRENEDNIEEENVEEILQPINNSLKPSEDIEEHKELQTEEDSDVGLSDKEELKLEDEDTDSKTVESMKFILDDVINLEKCGTDDSQYNDLMEIHTNITDFMIYYQNKSDVTYEAHLDNPRITEGYHDISEMLENIRDMIDDIIVKYNIWAKKTPRRFEAVLNIYKSLHNYLSLSKDDFIETHRKLERQNTKSDEGRENILSVHDSLFKSWDDKITKDLRMISNYYNKILSLTAPKK
jgi:hypothetical protein